MIKPTLLIINGSQFGHSSGHYFYCKYLTEEFKIIYICYDRGLSRLSLGGVEINYISFRGRRVSRSLRFLIACIRQCISIKPDILFVTYFNLCFFLNFFCRTRKTVLDIRTGSLCENRVVRKIENTFILLQSLAFNSVIILSEGLRYKLSIPTKKSRLVPLGSEIISKKDHSFNGISLLYIGTFDNRKISETIKGLHLFLEQNGYKAIKLSYMIIGFGSDSEIERIKDCIAKYKLSELVKIVGRKTHEELAYYFEEANVGIVYVPQKPWYDCQPSTKLFEYTLSGMPVIATNTHENRMTLNSTNGVLIEDSAEDFCIGLSKIYENRHFYNSDKIRKTVENYTWENIVNTNLKPYLLKLIE